MNEPFTYEEEIEEERVQPRSRIWRVLYAFVVILLIIIFLVNLTGLSHWLRIGRLSFRNLSGETEVSIIDRFGEPDFRSSVQPFVPGEGIGMVPQRLDEGDEFYFLNFVIGPRLVVFHFVSPETYTKHTQQLVLGDEWVVLEYYSGSRYVIY
jgi:hypothetical protein